MLFLPSALSKIYNTFIYERMLSSRVANVARMALSLKRTLVGGRRFRPNFWTSGIH